MRGNGFNVVNHLLAGRAVGDTERVKLGIRRCADGSGQIRVDGDDTVAGSEGFHGGV